MVTRKKVEGVSVLGCSSAREEREVWRGSLTRGGVPTNVQGWPLASIITSARKSSKPYHIVRIMLQVQGDNT
jgi:hypothetical protein